METSQTKATQMDHDHLSNLPDDVLVAILSFLPTRVSARTSVLSRRFQGLWKACPAVDLSITDPKMRLQSMANAVFLTRQPSNPLLRLRLFIGPAVSGIPRSFLPSLLTHSHSLGLRHLTLIDHVDIQSIVRAVFSISSLEYLSIFSLDTFSKIALPSATPLTHLKSLSIRNRVSSVQVEQLLLELCCLDHLQLTHLVQSTPASANLLSRTVKKLEVFAFSPFEKVTCSVGLFMPSLEFLFLSKRYNGPVPYIYGDIPLLRKCTITLDCLYPEHVAAVAQLLNCISHVEELSLYSIERSGRIVGLRRVSISIIVCAILLFQVYPFCNLFEPCKEAPAFPNLKHLDARMCFHDQNFEAIVSLLRRSPDLQSLKLVQKDAVDFGDTRKMYHWISTFPHNVDDCAYFNNLHLKENNEEFMKLLNKS